MFTEQMWVQEILFKKKSTLIKIGRNNENQITLVEEYECDQPIFHMMDSIFGKYITGCHKE